MKTRDEVGDSDRNFAPGNRRAPVPPFVREREGWGPGIRYSFRRQDTLEMQNTSSAAGVLPLLLQHPVVAAKDHVEPCMGGFARG